MVQRRDRAHARIIMAAERPSLATVLVSAVSPVTHASPTNVAYLLLACLIYQVHFPLDTAQRLHGESAPLVRHVWWMLQVLLRNLLLTGVVYGTWHYLLYVRRPPISDDKVNPKMPREEQHLRWVAAP